MTSLVRTLVDRAREFSETGVNRLPPRAQYVVRRAGRAGLPLARRAFESRFVQPLVSIVVPVYNVEAFLPECLDSLVGQTYRRLQIICVDDGSPDDSIDVLRAYAGRDPRIEIIRQANAGLGAARNVGAAKARGRFLMFVDSDDVLELDAIASYMRALRRSGSDFAVSSYRRMNAGGTWGAAPWIRAAHRRTKYATTLAESPDILVNAVAWSKCYRRDFWNRHHFRFPEGVLYEDQAVSARAYALADHFDLLAKVTVNWRIRHDGSSITQQRVAIDDLRARLDAAFNSLAELTRAGATLGHDVRLAQLLGNDFPLSIKSAQHADDEFWAVLTDGLRRLVAQANPQVWAQVPAQHRLAIRLVTEGEREAAIDFVGLGHDNPKNVPTLVRDGRAFVQFDAREALGLAWDDPLLELTETQLGQITGITGVRWLEDGRLEVRGWSYVDNVSAAAPDPLDPADQPGDGAAPTVTQTAVLVPVGPTHKELGRPSVELPADVTPDPAVTVATRHRYADYENCCFTLTVDVAALPGSTAGVGEAARTAVDRWRLDLRTELAGFVREGTLRGLQTPGGSRLLPGTFLPDGRRAELSFTNRNGLEVRVEPTLATLVSAVLTDRRLELAVRGADGFVPREVELGRSAREAPAVRVPVRLEDGAARVTVTVPDPEAPGRADRRAAGPVDPGETADAAVEVPEVRRAGPVLWTVWVVGLDGRRTALAVPDPTVLPDLGASGTRLRLGVDRDLVVVDEPRTVLVEELAVVVPAPVGTPGEVEGAGAPGTTVVRLSGVVTGGAGAVELRLAAPYAATTAVVRPGPGGRFEAELPLAADPWLTGVRPLPVGDYRLAARAVDPAPESSPIRAAGVSPADPDDADSAYVVELASTAQSRLPVDVTGPDVQGRLQAAAPLGLRLRLVLPQTVDEAGARPQQRLQNRLAARLPSPEFERGAVLFRSYFGETCSCNPLAVHRELRRRGTGHTLYWAVKDRSVAVPEGGIPVIHESAEWYRLLHDAEFYMDNMHQAIYHRKPAHQVQIQTFHGYPFKQMGQSHWAWQHRDVAHIRSYLERAADWDYLVSPATYGTEPLVREFGFPNEALEIGYPRNDVLQSPEAGAIRDDVRRRLGIRPDQQVVLYGPTFRDHLAQNDVRAPMVDFLDTRRLAAELGPDWVILVRGHAFNARVASRVGSRGTVLDVTDYPDINDLCLASDCAILDYSSLRFDYSLTGKPMLFMVPDLKLWTESARGSLFDYAPTAPGPMLVSTAEVAAALADLDGVRSEYADAYARFRTTYTDLDDGHAAERLVDRVFLRDR
ncbi:CDP-glycerol glycerophosphotransferase [Friedmanniella endophytica]|uniref:CDP-glycerol glycerophosphotransferase n=1 Tax=Microlunatus kandeliicorticis TaxID=1759536 RepID=A0A7W3ITL8_9ACTN|nr:CDP-glycerol glycerophosphotransferase family protein [Microlunatus kandeliicorticis]MBA8795006.1 CDP-glycerol glycerophosphotransferase [Microlunatus kandeliicorticis]